jgi:glutaminyl-tRNA synthetase
MQEEKSLHFIEEIVEEYILANKDTKIITRFPPEPNGYLHIGHAKSICLNFGLAIKYGGSTNLRFDDTNPSTEETEFVESIKNDVKWLGFSWAKELYASNYFDSLYSYAIALINKGLAYVDDSTAEQIAQQKGTPTQPGIANEFRERSVAENLLLFTAMKEGKFADGSKTLRAKIDMQHTNMLLRDPLIYRIKNVPHHKTGSKWCIYPMYDFAHGQSDAIENITHSICTLEFVAHRELYNWFIEKLELYPSKQYEFARLNITYTVLSKRKLLQLVNDNLVDGWTDPRMPTISGMRRRGYTPKSLRDFCDRIGIAKRENLIDVGLLEFCVREHLNKIAERRMVVFDPLKITITNLETTEILTTENNPENENGGTRTINFGNEIYIEREDFMEDAPKKYFRLSMGQMVRLKSAYIIKCNEVIKDSNGNITELKCSYLPNSKSGNDTSGVAVKSTIHWVNKANAVPITLNLYDRLFAVENVDAAEGDFKNYINPNSLSTITNAVAEEDICNANIDTRYQFLRKGYFTLDTNSTKDNLIFNRTVSLKDSWAKEQKRG